MNQAAKHPQVRLPAASRLDHKFPRGPTFFSARSNKRGWLHFAQTYDFLVVLVGFPLSLAIARWVDRLSSPSTRLPLPLTVALYVYLVLMVLYGFRLLFNYAKWVYPAVEIDAPGQRVAASHKGFLGFLFLTCAAIYLEALLRFVGALK